MPNGLAAGEFTGRQSFVKGFVCPAVAVSERHCMRPEFNGYDLTRRIDMRDAAWKKRKENGYSAEQADMDRLSEDYAAHPVQGQADAC